jgi:hypothetical protein
VRKGGGGGQAPQRGKKERKKKGSEGNEWERVARVIDSQAAVRPCAV